MPNHAHAILRPLQPQRYALEDILGSWKQHSARHINACRRDSGEVWQEESFDRIIRDEEHLWRAIQYIGRNPKLAGLVSKVPLWIRPEWERLGWRYADGVVVCRASEIFRRPGTAGQMGPGSPSYNFFTSSITHHAHPARCSRRRSRRLCRGFLAADEGLEVTLVEADPRLGGTCLLRGCIPSKALLHVARVIAEVDELRTTGESSIPPPKLDVEQDPRAEKKKSSPRSPAASSSSPSAAT